MPIDKSLIESLMDLQKLTTGLGGGKNWTQDLRGLVEMLQGLQGNSPQPWSPNLWNQTSLPPEIQKPHINIIESDKDVTVTTNLPGIKDSSDLAVRVKNDILQIIARSSALARSGAAGPDTQTFCRTVNLPAEVESRGAQATYQNGTIVIRLVKKNKPYDQLEVRFL